MNAFNEAEAEAAVLRAEFPQWDIWRGIDGLWHARWPEHYDPESRPVMVWGEDPADLRDQIRREVTVHDDRGSE